MNPEDVNTTQSNSTDSMQLLPKFQCICRNRKTIHPEIHEKIQGSQQSKQPWKEQSWRSAFPQWDIPSHSLGQLFLHTHTENKS